MGERGWSDCSGGGFAAVDALYREPPAGTLQLLALASASDASSASEASRASSHSSSPSALAALQAAAPPEPGWTLRHRDVLGAQTWRTVLEEWLPAGQAAELARGWDGDLLVWFTRGEERVLVWEVRTRAPLAAEVARVVSRALRLAAFASESPTRRATGFACRGQRDGAVLGGWIGERSPSIASLSGAAQSVQCASLEAWTIPATQRRMQRRDLGRRRLRGRTGPDPARNETVPKGTPTRAAGPFR